MSNNLVSQQLLILNKQVGQMEPLSNKLDPSISSMRIGPIGPISNYAASQKLVISDNQRVLVDRMSDSPGSQSLPALSKQIEQMEPKRSDLGSQQFILPNQHVGEMEAMFNNMGSQKLLSNKRRELMSNNFVPQQLPVINKPMAHMEILSGAPGLQPLSVPHKKTLQMQSISGTSGLQNSPTPNKRMVRNESISSKSGSQHSHTPKNRTAQMEHSPKVQTEPFESVRSKMRDSLASALALVSQHQNKAPNDEKKSQSEAAVNPRQMQEGLQPVESTSTSAVAADYVSENAMDTLPSKESRSADKLNDGQSTSQTIQGMDHSAQTLNCNGQEFQCNTFLLHQDVSLSDNFFVKDELLQGNGLSWAMDLDMEAAETKEVQAAKKPKLVHENVCADRGEQAVQSPQNLAFKIEAELFKLFGGVNKKYKEKGRSLLFNLKDRSNPELRERVFSGEISPERLCSMTAEELASKELSEWRMAKAEELAQMVVLPDLDIDIRRLVKKTHKGEFQVEVEQDDGVSVEVSVGTSSLSHNRPRKKKTETRPPSKSDGTNDKESVVDDKSKSSSENQDPSCSLTIPSDGTDLMQGLMVEELKDVEFLPPIVSLDEFMESLDTEPPFENLPVDAGKPVPHSDRESLEAGQELVASDLASKDPEDTTPDKVGKEGKADKVDIKYTELDAKVKSSEHLIEPKKSPPGGASKGEHVWEGILQLSISAMVTVVGCFRSGEETSTKEWPSSLEIKGRVRLDAFEKFLQELPMSRSRAVMVVQFVLKQGSSENDHASLSEVVDSYVMDERLGFAEPALGVELYFCPPHTKILEMLSKYLPKDHTEVLKSMDNGLIGVVVWRKAHLTSTVSPNSSSYHKRSSKKQHFSSRREQDKETNMNVNFASEPPLHRGVTSFNSKPPPDVVDDDDIPPGFGPARDEDDLPEFNFSGAPNPSVPKFSTQNPSQGSGMTPFQAPSHPVDHVRDLIHRYGQTGRTVASTHWQDKRGVGAGNQPWNDDDDDDDIPEWQPQAPQQQPTPQPQRHNSFQQPRLLHAVNKQHLGVAMPQQPMAQLASPVAMPSPSLHPPGNAMQGAWLARPSGHHVLRPSMPAILESQPSGGQYYGAPVHRAEQPSAEWRHEASRSRGF